jgi:NADPH-dependent ferric siderophore reductase
MATDPDPYRFFHLKVLRTAQLTPVMLRITLGGEQLTDFVSGGRDQRVKLFLPRPGQDAPILPDVRQDDWYDAWRRMDPAVRAFMRTYTVRAHRTDPPEIDLDFALHGDLGPGSRWARTAVPGARVGVFGPAVEENGGYDFQPPQDADWLLLTGDESALPAVAGILEHLTPGTRAEVFLEVPHADDRQPLATKADARVTWLVRDSRDSPGSLLAAVSTAELPAGAPYSWIAGESATVRSLRRHLLQERGFDRKAVKFTGYWRRGTSEDELLARDEDA